MPCSRIETIFHNKFHRCPSLCRIDQNTQDSTLCSIVLEDISNGPGSISCGYNTVVSCHPRKGKDDETPERCIRQNPKWHQNTPDCLHVDSARLSSYLHGHLPSWRHHCLNSSPPTDLRYCNKQSKDDSTRAKVHASALQVRCIPWRCFHRQALLYLQPHPRPAPSTTTPLFQCCFGPVQVQPHLTPTLLVDL